MIRGEGTIVSPHTRIRKPDLLTIGDCSIIDDFCYISCELSIGHHTHIGANCTFIGGNGKITIGNFVNVAPGCRIVCASHDYVFGGLSGPTIPTEYAGKSITGTVVINDHVLLGCNTVVLPNTYLPPGMATGAMTLVREKDYAPWCVYVGAPIQYYSQRDMVDILNQAVRLMCSQS